LEAVFESPPPANLRRSTVESLFEALGAEITEGQGSRARVRLRRQVGVFHRPHPRAEAGRGMLRSVRRFLESAGITP